MTFLKGLEYRFFISKLYYESLCYLLQCIGCPTILRMDYGTENGLTGAAQAAFCMNDGDSLAGEKSAMYGTSPANIVSISIMTALYWYSSACMHGIVIMLMLLI